ncbi:MAG: hypothetical protein Q7T86_11390 [Hyphomicrobiaceae bacterium]|nr:hypothetical protein [Hyphomicrobiaceae bacterium]
MTIGWTAPRELPAGVVELRIMKVAGFALLAAGLAFVFNAYSPSRFDHSVPIEAHESQPVAGQPPVRLTRNFSIDPAVTLMSVVDRAEARLERATQQQHAAALPVAVELPRAELTNQQPSAPAALLAASDDSNTSRASVVRRIKRELRRVGCYDGRIDSEWDRSSRAAMAAFVDRVNASLPSQEPDVVLLNLVRNHTAAACGATCPRGQAIDGDGRCLPDAIIAKLKRKANPVVAQNTPPMKPFTTTVMINEVRPTAATLPPPPKVAVQTATKAPLPGRMAMGGPVSETKASLAAPEKSWWDNFIGGVSPAPENAAQQTLDRPVGLTHVPQPPMVRRTQQMGETAPQQQANLATTSVEDGGSAADGTGDGTALTRAPALDEPTISATAPKARPARSYRKSARSKGKQKYARRGSGRNVQAMFQHPLGRL